VVVAMGYDPLPSCCELQIPQQIGFYQMNLHVCDAYVFNNMQFAWEKIQQHLLMVKYLKSKW
jgi:hypothetical protein